MAEPAYHGTRQAARDYIAEIAAGAGNHAKVCLVYARTDNDVGLLYAARCLRAYMAALDAGVAEIERLRALEVYRRRTGDLGPARESEKDFA